MLNIKKKENSMYVDLPLLKKHLNIDPDFNLDDEYLLHLGLAAEDAVAAHIDRPLETLCDEYCNLPNGLKQSIMLLVGNWYNSREAVAFGGSPLEVPLSYNYLIDRYIDYYPPLRKIKAEEDEETTEE